MLPRLLHTPQRWRPHLAARIAAGLIAAFFTTAPMLSAQETERARPETERAPAAADFGKLFDAVVERTAKSFWDKERLAEVGWEKRAAEVRTSVVEATSLGEATRRINALLAELKTSHTALLTPDDVDYYILLAVFGGAGMPQREYNEKFWGAGITYAASATSRSGSTAATSSTRCWKDRRPSGRGSRSATRSSLSMAPPITRSARFGARSANGPA
jgi:hypothetical protein